MFKDGEAFLRLNLIDDVADTHRPKEHGLAFGAADRLSWRAARPQDVVCHSNHSFSVLDGSGWTAALLSTTRNDLSWGARRRADNPARFWWY
jgi:hypothetical protein